jgi:hypothetical protein
MLPASDSEAYATLAENFWSQCSRSEDGCLLWQGGVQTAGYGSVRVGGFVMLTHRVAYELAHGRPITEGMTIDHKCHVRLCVEPSHLRELTPRQNASENSQGLATHCQHGHEFTEDNTYITPQGRRRCRQCVRDRRAANRASKCEPGSSG